MHPDAGFVGLESRGLGPILRVLGFQLALKPTHLAGPRFRCSHIADQGSNKFRVLLGGSWFVIGKL